LERGGAVNDRVYKTPIRRNCNLLQACARKCARQPC